MDKKLILTIVTAGSFIILGICLLKRHYKSLAVQKLNFLLDRDLPTSPEVEYIEGGPDFDAISDVNGAEVIRSDDIALGEGFGVGEGTFGFGRFGSSFMA